MPNFNMHTSALCNAPPLRMPAWRSNQFKPAVRLRELFPLTGDRTLFCRNPEREFSASTPVSCVGFELIQWAGDN